ncbi:MAG: YnbE family lipoprotein [Gammaproteobacteria bacterium]|nr:YnbE family lipoprotein [Gammaproteobacteria bacterium]MDH3430025.1 YnbE family lipoprotein [Gammaproteobacteria bacterium]MDH3433182.1 YnbE family lipoprotein [Gammaproteobacteria bacterium]
MKRILFCLLALGFAAGCTPTVQVAAPKEPIEINLNVKIEHEIRIQVDKELQGLFDEDSELF